MKLSYFEEIPAGFLDLDPRDFYTILPGPSIIELQGENPEPLFISTLLHGNETTGVYALQILLRKYFTGELKLPRSLIIFIGNIDAAKEGVRHLDNQLDFNRVWDGDGDTDQHKIAKEVLAFVESKKPFAAIDIHNNTGWNPYYGCVNDLDERFLNLAKLFTRRVVYFIRPENVIAIALNKFTTSVILECGQSGDMTGIQRTADFLESVLNLLVINNNPISNDEVSIFHSVASIKIPEQFSIGFSEHAHTDFRFVANFECLNFMELSEHSLLGWRRSKEHKLMVIDEHGNDVADQFIAYEGHEIRTMRPTIPSMFCEDEKVIRQDCLGYFMQRYQL